MNAQTAIGEIAIQQHNLAEAERILRNAAERQRRRVEPLKRLVSLLCLERRPAECRSLLRRLFQLTRDPQYLAESILISQLDSRSANWTRESRCSCIKTPRTPGCAGFGDSSSCRKVGWPRPCPTSKPRPWPSRTTPLGRFAWAECRMGLGISGDDLSILGPTPSGPVDAAGWWVLRGRLAEAWGQDDQALECLRKAVSADPQNLEAHYRLGRALMHEATGREARLTWTAPRRSAL